jgi:Ca-activated chloride channel family protein
MTWSDVSFDLGWTAALTVALAIPALVFGVLHWQQRQRTQRLSRFAHSDALSRLGANPTAGLARRVRLTFVAFLAAIALAGPRWGNTAATEARRGLDIAVALDASLSMLARDERPTRLDRMKQEVRRLRAASRADRLAIIAFAGRSYILSPLTADEGAIELYLENLSPESVGQAGTSLARAIRQGTELLGASTGNADRALVLMSDGEAFEPVEDVRAAAADAASKGILLVTVGFGSPDGATIPEPFGNTTRDKRDEQGNVVITRYMPELLEAAAEAAGGLFVPSDATDRAGRVRASFASLRTERRLVTSRDDHVARFAWFLVPALVLLLLDTWRSRTPVSRRSGSAVARGPVSAARTAGAWLLLLPLGAVSLGGCTPPPDPALRLAAGDALGAVVAYRALIAEGDTSLEMRYNLATALLAADSLAAASELLETVRRAADGEVRARARFNAGLARLLEARAASGDTADRAFAAARELYRAYLGERFDDIDAKWNYELALRDQPPSGGGGGGGDDDDSPQNPESSQQPGQLDQAQADALLNSAARDERDVQGKRQRMTRQPPPPGGRDW